jgi:hypothetical protein
VPCPKLLPSLERARRHSAVGSFVHSFNPSTGISGCWDSRPCFDDMLTVRVSQAPAQRLGVDGMLPNEEDALTESKTSANALVTFSEHIPLIEQMFEQPQPATSARTIKQPFLQYDNSCAPEMFRRIHHQMGSYHHAIPNRGIRRSVHPLLSRSGK